MISQAINVIRNARHNQKGFTLLEVIVVVAILAILVGLVLPNFSNTIGNAKTTMVQGQLEKAREACFFFHADTGTWPLEYSDNDASGYHQLTNGRKSDGSLIPNWNGPYLERPFVSNGWGGVTRIMCASSSNRAHLNNHAFDISTTTTSGSDCYLYLTKVPRKVCQSLDRKVDGTNDDFNHGSVIYHQASSGIDECSLGILLSGLGGVAAPPLPSNHPPIANDDTASIDGNSANNQINVLANDTDEDGDGLSITDVNNPSHGMASQDGSHVYYTPDANFYGNDSFTYTISDGKGGSDSATVTITILYRTINLPGGEVNLSVQYPGPESYFEVTLVNIPSGYDVHDGIWTGWCVDESHYIYPGHIYSSHLYSSYDPNLPAYAQDEDWDKVNYIINHKVSGATWKDIQDALWYFINGGNYPADPQAQAMISEANNYGEGYRPCPCEKVAAVVCDCGPLTQLIFIEVDP